MSIERRLFLQVTLAAIVTLFSGLSFPATAQADHGKIVVANRASSSISVIDASRGRLIRNVAMPPGENDPEPMYVVNTPFRNRVWVGDRANDRVVVFSGRTFEVVDILPTGTGVFHMWADFFGRELWVINDIDNTATVIDAIQLEVIATVPMPEDLIAIGATPHDVVLDPFGFFAYVTFSGVDPNFDVIVQFNTWYFEEVNRTAVGKSPHVSFNWRTWEVYSPCQGSDAVLVLDGLTMELTDIIDVPGAHGAITSFDARRFYTTNLPGGGADAVFCINTLTNQVIGEPADTEFDIPHNVVVTPSGRRLYVTHSGANNTVSVFRVRRDGTLRLLRDVTVEDNPFGLAYVR